MVMFGLSTLLVQSRIGNIHSYSRITRTGMYCTLTTGSDGPMYSYSRLFYSTSYNTGSLYLHTVSLPTILLNNRYHRLILARQLNEPGRLWSFKSRLFNSQPVPSLFPLHIGCTGDMCDCRCRVSCTSRQGRGGLMFEKRHVTRIWTHTH